MSYGNFAAFTPTKFSLKMVQVLYNKTVYTMCTNTKYEGEIKNEGDSVVIRTAGKVSIKEYTKGMTLVSEALTPTKETMLIDQMHYFDFEVDEVDKIQNDIDAISTYADHAKEGFEQVIDVEILDYARKNVLGDNILAGSPYAAGTVSIAANGVVTGSGTTFTAGMVGGLLKAAGHTKYYVVESRASNTSITIKEQGGEDYAGGVISGASYVINGATPVNLTKTTIYDHLVDLGELLDAQNAPQEGRFLVINSKLKALILKSPEFIKAVPAAYEGVIKKAHLGEIAGFQILMTQNVAGDNTNGYWYWAGSKEYMSFAAQILKTSVIPQEINPNSFMATCKGLLVFGRKVCDGNRGLAAFMRATIS